MSGVARGSVGRPTPGPPADAGSILPLILGYALLAIALIVVCVCATDLYVAQKRLDSVADAAALAGADGFRVEVQGTTIRAELTDDDVRAEAGAVLDVLDDGSELVSAESPDGVSARVVIRTTWTPPLVGDFVPPLLTLHATGTSRTALG